ncbi:STAS-like domain-containing protein, partial [bacterium]|nr:STAS-like domain-containing protein [bacterium]
VFFTSRCADMLTIKSSGKKLIYNNLIDDIFIKNIKLVKGTKILFSLALNSAKELKRIFDDYTDNGSFEFSKTEVKVKLHRMGNDYISRSQARRILNGLEKFQTIVLDFQDIDTVGQGFADEIFRVWLTKYSDKKVLSENTNENIDFMIKRVRRFNFKKSTRSVS